MYDDLLDTEVLLELSDRLDLQIWLGVRNTVFRDFESQRSGLSTDFSFRSDYGILKKTLLAIYFFPDLVRFCNHTLDAKNMLIITGENRSGVDNTVDAFGDYLKQNGTSYTSISFGKSKLDADFSLYSIVILSNLIAGVLSIFMSGKYTQRIQKILETFRRQYGVSCRVPLRYLVRKYIANKIFVNFFKLVLGQSLQKIKSVYLEEGHYQDKSQLVYMFKKNSVIVREQQHGMVHLNHDAYNYPYQLFEIYKDFLPDTLFVFADYWGELVRTPANIQTIGWYKFGGLNIPELEKGSGNRCLFIGSGLHTKESISAFNQLRLTYKDLVFVYRPHPSEKYEVDQLLDRTVVDQFALYRSLLVSNFVIGDMSTVLFEAQEIGCKVMGLKSAYLIGTGLDSLLPFCELDQLSNSNFFKK